MGSLYVVATPIGNMSDISSRALETMDMVDYILVEDTRQTIKILNHFNIKKKMVSYHKFNEDLRVESVIEDLRTGKNVALVSDAGTPCISDPGYKIVKSAREEGILVFGIPGASALITALSVSGLRTERFSFYGFLPRDNSKRKEVFDGINKSEIDTFVIYESPKRIKNTIKEIASVFPNSFISIGSDLTKLYERNIYGKASSVLELVNNDEKINLGEYVIIVEKLPFEKVETTISLEALIVNEIVNEGFDMKSAIEKISRKSKISKNALYKASLNIKEIFKKY